MTIITGMDKLMSLDARGLFGYSNGYGLIRFGYNKRGLRTDTAGIYQRKRLANGWGISRMKIYRPTNPQTTTQQNWRAVFAEGWTHYNALTSEQKVLLSKEARNYRMSGANLFMRRWLHSQRS